MTIFDITRPIHDGMVVYEGDPEVVIRHVASIAAGAPANVSALQLGSHTGTHVDPPRHFRDGAPGADALPLDILLGPARVYELDVRNQIDVSNLRRVDLTASPRILFKTCKVDDRTGDAALRACAGLTPDAADALVRAGVRLVGLDSASADPPSARGFPAHRRLLEAGVIILEDLDLSLVPPGAYELLCLPLKIRGGDGAPARVVLRALD